MISRMLAMNFKHIAIYIRYRSLQISLLRLVSEIPHSTLSLATLPMGDPLLLTTTMDIVAEPEVSMLESATLLTLLRFR